MTGPHRSNGRVKALFMAAGMGTRLRPLTDTVPKCLVPINGRPLVDYWFGNLRDAGIHDVLINTHHLRDEVGKYLDVQRAGGEVRVVEAYEPTLLGSAGTVTANREWMDDAETCVIVYVDNLTDMRLSDVLRRHAEHDAPFTMMLFHADEPKRCGIAELDGDSRIVGFEEKPEQPQSDLANGGVYVLTADAYREIADLRGHDIGFDVLPQFVGRMHGWVHEGYHRDIGTHASLEQANNDFPALSRAAESS